uniref:Uncharacterized protein n=1 Tax=Chromera velia CCMP2878 TaxID=1169474 RepID=A0A0G4HRG7_9ALVE|eukprot:Cvel_8068.t1-p1 / transcript=Cvel_8068.t1 / gene=Cvel_8068 / organism=Chromera_velia_CCMP2878 / gene_product=hypothetical protein / transcript_product=hypothetical protein / location=Cvel_scaffold437:32272-68280(-) / protein_length=6560 / sequence_SO=supercontig / SO=protein_coding / is_pseudo=false
MMLSHSSTNAPAGFIGNFPSLRGGARREKGDSRAASSGEERISSYGRSRLSVLDDGLKAQWEGEGGKAAVLHAVLDAGGIEGEEARAFLDTLAQTPEAQWTPAQAERADLLVGVALNRAIPNTSGGKGAEGDLKTLRELEEKYPKSARGVVADLPAQMENDPFYKTLPPEKQAEWIRERALPPSTDVDADILTGKAKFTPDVGTALQEGRFRAEGSEADARFARNWVSEALSSATLPDVAATAKARLEETQKPDEEFGGIGPYPERWHKKKRVEPHQLEQIDRKAGLSPTDADQEYAAEEAAEEIALEMERAEWERKRGLLNAGLDPNRPEPRLKKERVTMEQVQQAADAYIKKEWGEKGNIPLLKSAEFQETLAEASDEEEKRQIIASELTRRREHLIKTAYEEENDGFPQLSPNERVNIYQMAQLPSNFDPKSHPLAQRFGFLVLKNGIIENDEAVYAEMAKPENDQDYWESWNPARLSLNDVFETMDHTVEWHKVYGMFSSPEYRTELAWEGKTMKHTDFTRKLATATGMTDDDLGFTDDEELTTDLGYDPETSDKIPDEELWKTHMSDHKIMDSDSYKQAVANKLREEKALLEAQEAGGGQIIDMSDFANQTTVTDSDAKPGRFGKRLDFGLYETLDELEVTDDLQQRAIDDFKKEKEKIKEFDRRQAEDEHEVAGRAMLAEALTTGDDRKVDVFEAYDIAETKRLLGGDLAEIERLQGSTVADDATTSDVFDAYYSRMGTLKATQEEMEHLRVYQSDPVKEKPRDYVRIERSKVKGDKEDKPKKPKAQGEGEGEGEGDEDGGEKDSEDAEEEKDADDEDEKDEEDYPEGGRDNEEVAAGKYELKEPGEEEDEDEKEALKKKTSDEEWDEADEQGGAGNRKELGEKAWQMNWLRTEWESLKHDLAIGREQELKDMYNDLLMLELTMEGGLKKNLADMNWEEIREKMNAGLLPHRSLDSFIHDASQRRMRAKDIGQSIPGMLPLTDAQYSEAYEATLSDEEKMKIQQDADMIRRFIYRPDKFSKEHGKADLEMRMQSDQLKTQFDAHEIKRLAVSGGLTSTELIEMFGRERALKAMELSREDLEKYEAFRRAAKETGHDHLLLTGPYDGTQIDRADELAADAEDTLAAHTNKPWSPYDSLKDPTAKKTAPDYKPETEKFVKDHENRLESMRPEIDRIKDRIKRGMKGDPEALREMIEFAEDSDDRETISSLEDLKKKFHQAEKELHMNPFREHRYDLFEAVRDRPELLAQLYLDAIRRGKILGGFDPNKMTDGDKRRMDPQGWLFPDVPKPKEEEKEEEADEEPGPVWRDLDEILGFEEEMELRKSDDMDRREDFRAVGEDKDSGGEGEDSDTGGEKEEKKDGEDLEVEAESDSAEEEGEGDEDDEEDFEEERERLGRLTGLSEPQNDVDGLPTTGEVRESIMGMGFSWDQAQKMMTNPTYLQQMRLEDLPPGVTQSQIARILLLIDPSLPVAKRKSPKIGDLDYTVAKRELPGFNEVRGDDNTLRPPTGPEGYAANVNFQQGYARYLKEKGGSDSMDERAFLEKLGERPPKPLVHNDGDIIRDSAGRVFYEKGREAGKEKRGGGGGMSSISDAIEEKRDKSRAVSGDEDEVEDDVDVDTMMDVYEGRPDENPQHYREMPWSKDGKLYHLPSGELVPHPNAEREYPTDPDEEEQETRDDQRKPSVPTNLPGEKSQPSWFNEDIMEFGDPDLREYQKIMKKAHKQYPDTIWVPPKKKYEKLLKGEAYEDYMESKEASIGRDTWEQTEAMNQNSVLRNWNEDEEEGESPDTEDEEESYDDFVREWKNRGSPDIPGFVKKRDKMLGEMVDSIEEIEREADEDGSEVEENEEEYESEQEDDEEAAGDHPSEDLGGFVNIQNYGVPTEYERSGLLEKQDRERSGGMLGDNVEMKEDEEEEVAEGLKEDLVENMLPASRPTLHGSSEAPGGTLPFDAEAPKVFPDWTPGKKKASAEEILEDVVQTLGADLSDEKREQIREDLRNSPSFRAGEVRFGKGEMERQLKWDLAPGLGKEEQTGEPDTTPIEELMKMDRSKMTTNQLLRLHNFRITQATNLKESQRRVEVAGRQLDRLQLSELRGMQEWVMDHPEMGTEEKSGLMKELAIRIRERERELDDQFTNQRVLEDNPEDWWEPVLHGQLSAVLDKANVWNFVPEGVNAFEPAPEEDPQDIRERGPMVTPDDFNKPQRTPEEEEALEKKRNRGGLKLRGNYMDYLSLVTGVSKKRLRPKIDALSEEEEAALVYQIRFAMGEVHENPDELAVAETQGDWLKLKREAAAGKNRDSVAFALREGVLKVKRERAALKAVREAAKAAKAAGRTFTKDEAAAVRADHILKITQEIAREHDELFKGYSAKQVADDQIKALEDIGMKGLATTIKSIRVHSHPKKKQKDPQTPMVKPEDIVRQTGYVITANRLVRYLLSEQKKEETGKIPKGSGGSLSQFRYEDIPYLRKCGVDIFNALLKDCQTDDHRELVLQAVKKEREVDAKILEASWSFDPENDAIPTEPPSKEEVDKMLSVASKSIADLDAALAAEKQAAAEAAEAAAAEGGEEASEEEEKGEDAEGEEGAAPPVKLSRFEKFKMDPINRWRFDQRAQWGEGFDDEEHLKAENDLINQQIGDADVTKWVGMTGDTRIFNRRGQDDKDKEWETPFDDPGSIGRGSSWRPDWDIGWGDFEDEIGIGEELPGGAGPVEQAEAELEYKYGRHLTDIDLVYASNDYQQQLRLGKEKFQRLKKLFDRRYGQLVPLYAYDLNFQKLSKEQQYELMDNSDPAAVRRDLIFYRNALVRHYGKAAKGHPKVFALIREVEAVVDRLDVVCQYVDEVERLVPFHPYDLATFGRDQYELITPTLPWSLQQIQEYGMKTGRDLGAAGFWESPERPDLHYESWDEYIQRRVAENEYAASEAAEDLETKFPMDLWKTPVDEIFGRKPRNYTELALQAASAPSDGEEGEDKDQKMNFPIRVTYEKLPEIEEEEVTVDEGDDLEPITDADPIPLLPRTQRDFQVRDHFLQQVMESGGEFNDMIKKVHELSPTEEDQIAAAKIQEQEEFFDTKNWEPEIADPFFEEREVDMNLIKEARRLKERRRRKTHDVGLAAAVEGLGDLVDTGFNNKEEETAAWQKELKEAAGVLEKQLQEPGLDAEERSSIEGNLEFVLMQSEKIQQELAAFSGWMPDIREQLRRARIIIEDPFAFADELAEVTDARARERALRKARREAMLRAFKRVKGEIEERTSQEESAGAKEIEEAEKWKAPPLESQQIDVKWKSAKTGKVLQGAWEPSDLRRLRGRKPERLPKDVREYAENLKEIESGVAEMRKLRSQLEAQADENFEHMKKEGLFPANETLDSFYDAMPRVSGTAESSLPEGVTEFEDELDAVEAANTGSDYGPLDEEMERLARKQQHELTFLEQQELSKYIRARKALALMEALNLATDILRVQDQVWKQMALLLRLLGADAAGRCKNPAKKKEYWRILPQLEEDIDDLAVISKGYVVDQVNRKFTTVTPIAHSFNARDLLKTLRVYIQEDGLENEALTRWFEIAESLPVQESPLNLISDLKTAIPNLRKMKESLTESTLTELTEAASEALTGPATQLRDFLRFAAVFKEFLRENSDQDLSPFGMIEERLEKVMKTAVRDRFYRNRLAVLQWLAEFEENQEFVKEKLEQMGLPSDPKTIAPIPPASSNPTFVQEVQDIADQLARLRESGRMITASQQARLNNLIFPASRYDRITDFFKTEWSQFNETFTQEVKDDEAWYAEVNEKIRTVHGAQAWVSEQIGRMRKDDVKANVDAMKQVDLETLWAGGGDLDEAQIHAISPYIHRIAMLDKRLAQFDSEAEATKDYSSDVTAGLRTPDKGQKEESMKWEEQEKRKISHILATAVNDPVEYAKAQCPSLIGSDFLRQLMDATEDDVEDLVELKDKTSRLAHELLTEIRLRKFVADALGNREIDVKKLFMQEKLQTLSATARKLVKKRLARMRVVHEGMQKDGILEKLEADPEGFKKELERAASIGTRVGTSSDVFAAAVSEKLSEWNECAEFVSALTDQTPQEVTNFVVSECKKPDAASLDDSWVKLVREKVIDAPTVSSSSALEDVRGSPEKMQLLLKNAQVEADDTPYQSQTAMFEVLRNEGDQLIEGTEKWVEGTGGLSAFLESPLWREVKSLQTDVSGVLDLEREREEITEAIKTCDETLRRIYAVNYDKETKKDDKKEFFTLLGVLKKQHAEVRQRVIDYRQKARAYGPGNVNDVVFENWASGALNMDGDKLEQLMDQIFALSSEKRAIVEARDQALRTKTESTDEEIDLRAKNFELINEVEKLIFQFEREHGGCGSKEEFAEFAAPKMNVTVNEMYGIITYIERQVAAEKELEEDLKVFKGPEENLQANLMKKITEQEIGEADSAKIDLMDSERGRFMFKDLKLGDPRDKAGQEAWEEMFRVVRAHTDSDEEAADIIQGGEDRKGILRKVIGVNKDAFVAPNEEEDPEKQIGFTPYVQGYSTRSAAQKHTRLFLRKNERVIEQMRVMGKDDAEIVEWIHQQFQNEHEKAGGTGVFSEVYEDLSLADEARMTEEEADLYRFAFASTMFKLKFPDGYPDASSRLSKLEYEVAQFNWAEAMAAELKKFNKFLRAKLEDKVLKGTVQAEHLGDWETELRIRREVAGKKEQRGLAEVEDALYAELQGKLPEGDYVERETARRQGEYSANFVFDYDEDPQNYSEADREVYEETVLVTALPYDFENASDEDRAALCGKVEGRSRLASQIKAKLRSALLDSIRPQIEQIVDAKVKADASIAEGDKESTKVLWTELTVQSASELMDGVLSDTSHKCAIARMSEDDQKQILSARIEKAMDLAALVGEAFDVAAKSLHAAVDALTPEQIEKTGKTKEQLHREAEARARDERFQNFVASSFKGDSASVWSLPGSLASIESMELRKKLEGEEKEKAEFFHEHYKRDRELHGLDRKTVEELLEERWKIEQILEGKDEKPATVASILEHDQRVADLSRKRYEMALRAVKSLSEDDYIKELEKQALDPSSPITPLDVELEKRARAEIHGLASLQVHRYGQPVHAMVEADIEALPIGTYEKDLLRGIVNDPSRIPVSKQDAKKKADRALQKQAEENQEELESFEAELREAGKSDQEIEDALKDFKADMASLSSKKGIIQMVDLLTSAMPSSSIANRVADAGKMIVADINNRWLATVMDDGARQQLRSMMFLESLGVDLDKALYLFNEKATQGASRSKRAKMAETMVAGHEKKIGQGRLPQDERVKLLRETEKALVPMLKSPKQTLDLLRRGGREPIVEELFEKGLAIEATKLVLGQKVISDLTPEQRTELYSQPDKKSFARYLDDALKLSSTIEEEETQIGRENLAEMNAQMDALPDDPEVDEDADDVVAVEQNDESDLDMAPQEELVHPTFGFLGSIGKELEAKADELQKEFEALPAEKRAFRYLTLISNALYGHTDQKKYADCTSALKAAEYLSKVSEAAADASGQEHSLIASLIGDTNMDLEAFDDQTVRTVVDAGRKMVKDVVAFKRNRLAEAMSEARVQAGKMVHNERLVNFLDHSASQRVLDDLTNDLQTQALSTTEKEAKELTVLKARALRGVAYRLSLPGGSGKEASSLVKEAEQEVMVEKFLQNLNGSGISKEVEAEFIQLVKSGAAGKKELDALVTGEISRQLQIVDSMKHQLGLESFASLSNVEKVMEEVEMKAKTEVQPDVRKSMEKQAKMLTREGAHMELRKRAEKAAALLKSKESLIEAQLETMFPLSKGKLTGVVADMCETKRKELLAAAQKEVAQQLADENFTGYLHLPLAAQLQPLLNYSPEGFDAEHVDNHPVFDFGAYTLKQQKEALDYVDTIGKLPDRFTELFGHEKLLEDLKKSGATEDEIATVESMLKKRYWEKKNKLETNPYAKETDEDWEFEDIDLPGGRKIKWRIREMEELEADVAKDPQDPTVMDGEEFMGKVHEAMRKLRGERRIRRPRELLSKLRFYSGIGGESFTGVSGRKKLDIVFENHMREEVAEDGDLDRVNALAEIGASVELLTKFGGMDTAEGRSEVRDLLRTADAIYKGETAPVDNSRPRLHEAVLEKVWDQNARDMANVRDWWAMSESAGTFWNHNTNMQKKIAKARQVVMESMQGWKSNPQEREKEMSAVEKLELRAWKEEQIQKADRETEAQVLGEAPPDTDEDPEKDIAEEYRKEVNPDGEGIFHPNQVEALKALWKDVPEIVDKKYNAPANAYKWTEEDEDRMNYDFEGRHIGDHGYALSAAEIFSVDENGTPLLTLPKLMPYHQKGDQVTLDHWWKFPDNTTAHKDIWYQDYWDKRHEKYTEARRAAMEAQKASVSAEDEGKEEPGVTHEDQINYYFKGITDTDERQDTIAEDIDAVPEVRDLVELRRTLRTDYLTSIGEPTNMVEFDPLKRSTALIANLALERPVKELSDEDKFCMKEVEVLKNAVGGWMRSAAGKERYVEWCFMENHEEMQDEKEKANLRMLLEVNAGWKGNTIPVPVMHVEPGSPEQPDFPRNLKKGKAGQPPKDVERRKREVLQQANIIKMAGRKGASNQGIL